jgi:SAM-dependent methyltransferase
MTNLKSSEEPAIQSNELFNKQWNIYQKIIQNNYMGHREISGILNSLLTNYFQKPFSLLDLGCGDASFTSQALLNTTLAAYQGIDLSEVALEIAHSNMKPFSGTKNFTQGDFSVLVPELVKSLDKFDAILASFAIHHLNLEQKDSLISQIKSLLKSDGVFIFIDLVRLENEEREAYIRRYIDDVRQHWEALTPQEFSMVEDHISSSDFPETQKTLYSLSRKHSFSNIECLYQDSLDTTQLLCFY